MTPSAIVTRFAPSPTGRLHVGNIRTALVNWLFARQNGGRFLLRLDDTDRQRSTEAYAEAIRSDLDWLGLRPDAEVRQSDRMALYEAAFERLRAAGRIYPAYETADELDIKRKVQLSRGLPPVYDRAALNLSDDDRAALEADGRRPHWRFRLDTAAETGWTDQVRGPSHVDPASLSDPVVRREDGSYLYMLPSVVDDIDMGITHVVRGEDHVTNSGVQVQMFAALGAGAPAFAHLSLLTGAQGGKLSKRVGSMGVDELRGQGFEAGAVTSFLARIGTSQPVVPVPDLNILAKDFDFSAFGRAAARFDPEELAHLNAKLVHILPYDQVADRLPQGMNEAAWSVLRPNLNTVSDAADWWQVVTGPLTMAPQPAERDFLIAARDALTDLGWGDDIWKRWTADVKGRTGRKGKTLFQPLRLALTGREQGPDMSALVRLIGREAALQRLEEAAGPVGRSAA